MASRAAVLSAKEMPFSSIVLTGQSPTPDSPQAITASATSARFFSAINLESRIDAGSESSISRVSKNAPTPTGPASAPLPTSSMPITASKLSSSSFSRSRLGNVTEGLWIVGQKLPVLYWPAHHKRPANHYLDWYEAFCGEILVIPRVCGVWPVIPHHPVVILGNRDIKFDFGGS